MNERPTEIKGFKRMPYLPRLGKIRLGVKCISKKTGKEYPKEVEYFVCPPEFKGRWVRRKNTEEAIKKGEPYWISVWEEIYGEKPKKLDIMFPSEDQAEVIPFCYKSYGSNQRLKCRGDGEVATWFNPETKAMDEKKCPCPALEKGLCGKRGHLMVILPRISLGGVYQIDTGSGANINRILDAMDYWKGMVGRCKCIPLTLERVQEKMLNPVDGTMQTHYLFRFSTELSTETLNEAIENNRKILAIEYKVEKPIEEGKLDDTPVEIVEEGEVVEEKKKDEDLTDLGLGDKHKPPDKAEPKKQPEKKQKFLCENCGDPVSQAELGYSKKNCDGKIFCFSCQKTYKKGKSQ